MNENYKNYLLNYIIDVWDFKADGEHINKDEVILLKDYIKGAEEAR